MGKRTENAIPDAGRAMQCVIAGVLLLAACPLIFAPFLIFRTADDEPPVVIFHKFPD